MFNSLRWSALPLCLSLFLLPAAAEAAPPETEAEPAGVEGGVVGGTVGPESEAVPGDAPAGEPVEPEPVEPEPVEPEPTEPEPTEPEPTEGALEGPAGTEQARPEPEPLPEGPPPEMGDKHSVVYTSLLAPRINPLGLEERLWIGYQYRLYNKNKAILNGSNLGVFFRPVVSPAIVLIGATLQFQPAAVFRLRATYSYVAYFGTFQYMQSYQSPHDDFSETRLGAQADAGENYVSAGHQVELEALIQARYKGLVLRSTTVANYNTMKLRGDDDVFYDVRLDALVPNNGWVLFNDTDLLWIHDFKNEKRSSLLAGARASTVMPFYPKTVYEPGESTKNPNGPQFRLGPEVGYVFYDRPVKRRRFNKPTLLLLSQWNIKHRWRTGRDVSTAFPTIIMAFAFSGQFWGKN